MLGCSSFRHRKTLALRAMSRAWARLYRYSIARFNASAGKQCDNRAPFLQQRGPHGQTDPGQRGCAARRFADDAACDAALAAFADTAALRALRELVEAQHRYLQAEFEVAQVADVLRRDQKYAPVGRPSINIVQLRSRLPPSRRR